MRNRDLDHYITPVPSPSAPIWNLHSLPVPRALAECGHCGTLYSTDASHALYGDGEGRGPEVTCVVCEALKAVRQKTLAALDKILKDIPEPKTGE